MRLFAIASRDTHRENMLCPDSGYCDYVTDASCGVENNCCSSFAYGVDVDTVSNSVGGSAFCGCGFLILEHVYQSQSLTDCASEFQPLSQRFCRNLLLFLAVLKTRHHHRHRLVGLWELRRRSDVKVNKFYAMP